MGAGLAWKLTKSGGIVGFRRDQGVSGGIGGQWGIRGLGAGRVCRVLVGSGKIWQDLGGHGVCKGGFGGMWGAISTFSALILELNVYSK